MIKYDYVKNQTSARFEPIFFFCKIILVSYNSDTQKGVTKKSVDYNYLKLNGFQSLFERVFIYLILIQF